MGLAALHVKAEVLLAMSRTGGFKAKKARAGVLVLVKVP